MASPYFLSFLFSLNLTPVSTVCWGGKKWIWNAIKAVAAFFPRQRTFEGKWWWDGGRNHTAGYTCLGYFRSSGVRCGCTQGTGNRCSGFINPLLNACICRSPAGTDSAAFIRPSQGPDVRLNTEYEWMQSFQARFSLCLKNAIYRPEKKQK